MPARPLTLLAASLAGLMAVALTGIGSATPAEAGARPAKSKSYTAYRNRKLRKRRPQVRGYIGGVGGYSFSAADTVNTTIGTRSLYGGTNVFRDRQLDTQTLGGPFDHGFFFNSPISPRGGDSPYYQ